MERRTLAWLMAAPLAAAGTYVSTCQLLASLGAAPHAGRMPPSAFFGSIRFLLTCGVVLALVLAVWLLARARDRGARLSAWPFGLLPPLFFVVHHELAPLVGAGSGLAWLAEPKLVVGLLFQVCVGLVTFLLAGVLLRVADRLAAALKHRRGPLQPGLARTPSPAFLAVARCNLLATAAAPRAPPLSLSPS
jgi:hypothetical protein